MWPYEEAMILSKIRLANLKNFAPTTVIYDST